MLLHPLLDPFVTLACCVHDFFLQALDYTEAERSLHFGVASVSASEHHHKRVAVGCLVDAFLDQLRGVWRVVLDAWQVDQVKVNHFITLNCDDQLFFHVFRIVPLLWCG